jgi:hypothetical protein
MTRPLYAISNGSPLTSESLGLRHEGASLQIMDITARKPLFRNYFGRYSEKALERIISSAIERKHKQPIPRYSLATAQELLAKFHSSLARGFDSGSRLISDYQQLKGYSFDEVRDQVDMHGKLVAQIMDDKILAKMISIGEDAKDYFASNETKGTFGIVASGNLGLLETALLVDTVILAQAAKNGNKVSVIFKPSIEDALTYDLIMSVPVLARDAFSRITWRSDVMWDEPLLDKYFDSLEGAIAFGKKKTLLSFADRIPEEKSDSFRWYYDHFPLMIVGPQSDNLLENAAEKAVNLAYRNKGEACLSLQNIFVHKRAYGQFVQYLREMAGRVNEGKEDIPLPRYSSDFLNELRATRNALIDRGATVSGAIKPESNLTEILVASDVRLSDPLIHLETAAPLILVMPYSNETELSDCIARHFSSEDKHTYALVIGDGSGTQTSTLLKSRSHRYYSARNAGEIKRFEAFEIGKPHSGGHSFIADMFGIPRRTECYQG